MAKSRRLIDFPLPSVQTQFLQGMVRGLPAREKRLQREAVDRRRQEDFDFRAEQAETRQSQDTKKAIWGFITGANFKAMTPEAQQQILQRVQDQGFQLPVDLPSVALGQPTGPPDSLGVAQDVSPQQPTLAQPPGLAGLAGGLPGQPTPAQPTTAPPTSLFTQPDPIFKEARVAQAQRIANRPTRVEEAAQDTKDATAKASRDAYKSLVAHAKEIATDDALDPTDRVTAINGLELRSGDKKRWVARAKIKRRPTRTKPPSRGSLMRTIINIDNQLALEIGSDTPNLTKIDGYKEQRVITKQLLDDVNKRLGFQAKPPPPVIPPPKPTAPPLTPETAPTAESNKNTPDSVKVVEQWKAALPADISARYEHFVKEGRTSWEQIYRKENP